ISMSLRASLIGSMRSQQDKPCLTTENTEDTESVPFLRIASGEQGYRDQEPAGASRDETTIHLQYRQIRIVVQFESLGISATANIWLSRTPSASARFHQPATPALCPFPRKNGARMGPDCAPSLNAARDDDFE